MNLNNAFYDLGPFSKLSLQVPKLSNYIILMIYLYIYIHADYPIICNILLYYNIVSYIQCIFIIMLVLKHIHIY